MHRRFWTVSQAEAGSRIGSYLTARLEGSSSQRKVKRELERGCCLVNGDIETYSSRRLNAGDVVLYCGGEDPAGARQLVITERGILFEDERYLAYDKPAGYPCQQSKLNRGGRNLFDELLVWLQKRDGPEAYLGQVHRLDRDTSGVILYVKDRAGVARVTRAFREHKVQKTYHALAHSGPLEDSGTWETRLAKLRDTPQVERWGSTSTTSGKRAVTDYRVRERFGRAACLLELSPRTGRTHQLRVHCSEAGCHILGDVLYGGTRPLSLRGRPHLFIPPHHLLHASELTMDDPLGGTRLTVRSRWPEEFQQARTRLRELVSRTKKSGGRGDGARG